MNVHTSNVKTEGTIAQIDNALRKRASEHERVARALRKATRQLHVSAKLIGEPEYDDLATRFDDLATRFNELWIHFERLGRENTSLLAHVLDDDPIVVTMVAAAE